MKRLSDKMFYKYLRCPHWVYWDLYGDADEAGETSELFDKIREHAVLRKEEYLAAFSGAETVPEDADEEERFRRTVELMKRGSAAIFRGRLMSGDWVGTPDILVKEKTPAGTVSRLGDWIYVPYVIKSAVIVEEKDLRDEYRFELAFYALLLEKLQGVRPDEGFVVAADKTIHGILIASALDEFHLTLREIEKILDGKKPAPFLSSSCKESPWFDLCRREAEACDDICLIYKIRRPDHALLYEAGIKTVGALAGMSLDALERVVPGMSRRKLEMLARQARSLRDKKTIVIQKPEFPAGTPEYYFDVEGDPLRNLQYLFGLLKVGGPRAKGTYAYALADGPGDEKNAWLSFLELVKKIPDAAPVYHYGTYERTVVARFADLYGGDAATIEKLKNSLFNLLPVVCESVALPVYFYSLKDIAKELGFKWRHKAASGANSIVWYEDYLRLAAGKKSADRAKAKKLLADIIAYNEDDVRATLFLKRRLERLPEPEDL